MFFWDRAGEYLIGMAGFLRPKFVSKMNPSKAIKTNWANVTMFPHPRKSLKGSDHRESQLHFRYHSLHMSFNWRQNSLLL